MTVIFYDHIINVYFSQVETLCCLFIMMQSQITILSTVILICLANVNRGKTLTNTFLLLRNRYLENEMFWDLILLINNVACSFQMFVFLCLTKH